MAAVALVPKGPAVAVTDGCLNSRHRGVACSRCADVCPFDAIAVVAGRPQLDEAACLGCGICMPQCPTQAFVDPRSDRSLHLALADAPAGAPVRLACPLGATDPTAMSTIRHDRCLAALGAEELVDLAGDTARDLWLDDAPCATCGLADLHSAVERAASDANQIRAAFGLAPLVHLTSVEPATALTHEPAGRVTDVNGGAVSRRGLFRRLVNVATEPSPDVDRDAPARRLRLLRRLRRWTTGSPLLPSSISGVPGFGVVRVDPALCSACGLCATFCSTGALRFGTSACDGGSDAFWLAFEASRCIDCGLCSVACPERAVTIESRLDPAAVVSGSSTILASGPLAGCSVCGSATAARAAAHDRCFGCRGGVVSPLRDEIGLMADLLSRVPSRVGRSGRHRGP